VPGARLLGPLSYLADRDLHDAFDLALRHDVVVGNERDLLTVTGTWSIADASAALQSRMAGANLRAAVATRGAAGCRIVTRDEAWQVPAFAVEVVDPTGAGDAFTAGVAYGLARRWDWPRIGRFANALGALAIRALGAQSSLPTLTEIEALLRQRPALD
jgi:ribokinase